jgi:hypothetical protein
MAAATSTALASQIADPVRSTTCKDSAHSLVLVQVTHVQTELNEVKLTLKAKEQKVKAIEQKLEAAEQELWANKDENGSPLSADQKADLRTFISNSNAQIRALNAQINTLFQQLLPKPESTFGVPHVPRSVRLRSDMLCVCVRQSTRQAGSRNRTLRSSKPKSRRSAAQISELSPMS